MLIKKIFLSAFFIVLFAFSASAVDIGSISAESAVIINRQTKEVVYEKNAYEKRSMASTTKIMTALLACESGKLYETVEITSSMCGAEGTSIGLKPGYKIRLYDLVYGMMLESGNDAANAVAIFLGGSYENFSKMMNEKAYSIGMRCTNFVTPSGLDDENHYTTAYDMAILGNYAMDNVVLKEICSSKNCKVDFIYPDITVTYSNHNRLLNSYSGTYGIKTGFTKKSGRCLVSAASGEKGDFVCVTLSAPDDWNDHKKMFDYAFETSFREDVYIRIPETLTVVGGVFSEIQIKTDYPVTLFMNKEGDVKQKVYLSSFVYAPVKKGDVLGFVELTLDDKTVSKVSIIADEDCDSIEATYVPKKSILSKIKEKISHLMMLV